MKPPKSSASPPPDPPEEGELETSALAPGLRLWNPQPLARPQVDASLPSLPWVKRGIEVLLFSLARLEYWLSPSGWLRAWIRLNLLLTAILAVCSATLIPVVTTVLSELRNWTGLAENMVGHVVQAVRSLPPVAVAIGSIVLLVQLLRVYRNRQRRRHYYQNDPYEEYS